MSIEYVMLALSVLLLFALLMIQVGIGTRQYGGSALAGSRDGLGEPSKTLARVNRTVENHKEGLILFAPLLLVAGQTSSFDGLTTIGAQLFFYSRVVHAILYLIGAPVIRPLVWMVGIFGTGMIFVSLFS